MFKKIKKAVTAIALVTIFAANAQAQTLIFSDEGVPNDPHIKGMQVFGDELAKLTDGDMDVKVYHSAQLMNKISALTAIRRGRGVDIIYTSPTWLSEYVPYMSMFASSYLFNDYEHMTKVLNGPIGQQIFDDIAAKTGIRPLAAFYYGTRQLNLRSDQKIDTPADLQGVKLRMPNSKSWMEMAKSLGANPTPLAFPEVYMGLKTGAIDGQDNPLPTDKNAKFYEVTQSIVLTDHFIDPFFPSMNERKWQALSDEKKAAILSALEIARKYVDNEVLTQEKELVDFFKSQGLSVYAPNKAAFIDYARDYYKNSPSSKDWNMALYDQITAK
ncbi:sialic acid TRAP transporter substrate-binding protein SiaP [Vibrio sp. SS-MA-C1-2]|uniref:sialic acid TRAP transporter substrate-binding protein SiaP n=1 Tax=Vibrio sp. SS-MA-C1-2 TaxID=2908646 RepID=UPI001F2A1910|nr:sialic acid TRAP transporter substrate-binding protein SiaP [Vibrio sp. SS-MA-C1-2]UJF17810.1 sialic acid TRAP transporter substrate-binding protein SiaP [Vibrio sp. SS-MA-C1-2]